MIRTTWTIARKELKSYLDKPTGYILLGVFSVLTFFLFFRMAYLSGEASLRPLSSMLPWILLFFVPAISMRLLAEEDRQGTLEILLTQPVSEIEVLAGKFLGAFLFIGIALGLTVTMPISLSFAGRLDWGMVVAQYLAALSLVAVFAAVGLATSGLTKNQVVASILAVVINFCLIIISVDIISLAVPPAVGQALASLSVMTHYENMARGVVELRDVVYFISLTAAFGALALLSLKVRKINRASEGYRNLQTGVAAIVVIAILANLVVGYTSMRLDLTSGRLFTLSPATAGVVGDIEDVVTVKVYASSNLPPQVALTFRNVKDMLADYRRASGGRLQVIYKYPDGDPKVAQEAQGGGIGPVQFQSISSEEFQIKQGYLGMVLTFRDKTERIPFVGQTNDLEYQLTSLIRKMTAKDKKVVAFLTGHGEKARSEDYAALDKELSKVYDVKEVSSTKIGGLPLAGVDALVVAGPTKKISAGDRAAIEKHLAAGGSALFLIDQFTVNPQFPFANRNADSFADFVEEYGVRINPDIIYDLRSNENVSFSGGAMAYTVPYPFWPKLGVAATSLVSNLKSAVLPWPSSVEAVKGDTQTAAVKTVRLLATSQYAGVESKDFSLMPDRKWNEAQLKSRQAAVAVTGEAGGGAGGKKAATKGRKSFRMIVVGDSDFPTERFAQNAPQNVAFVMNSIDWLAREDTLSSIRAKEATPRALVFSSVGQKEMLRYFNLIGVPLAVAIFGAVHLLRRRRRSLGAAA